MIHMAEPHYRILRPEQNYTRMKLSDYEYAACEEGLRCELIDGVLQMAPAPNPYHQDLVVAILRLLSDHTELSGRKVFAHVAIEPRVFVTDEEEEGTVPEPDVAAYLTYPPKPVDSYRNLKPSLVVEVVSPVGRAKDYVRNVAIYADVPQILEYWIVDPKGDRARPRMTIHRRPRGDQPFLQINVPNGGVYESIQWPGLRLDLSRIAVE